MKTAIVFAVLAFVLSATATTLVRVRSGLREAAQVAGSARVVADSIRARVATARRDTTPHDSIRAPGARQRDSAAKRDTVLAAAPADTGRPTPSAVPPRPAEPPRESATGPRASPAVDPQAVATAYKQVARVLSSMKPPEAAKVLAFLSDAEVEGILRAVGPRQAADFLTNIPKERAAALSRRLLIPRAGGPT